MKMTCKTCGAHFPEDFGKTMSDECEFWESRGLEALSNVDRHAVWKWLFSYDLDDLFCRTGISLAIEIKQINGGVPWEDIYPGYKLLTEKDQRELQAIHTKLIREANAKWDNSVIFRMKVRLWTHWLKVLKLFR